MPRSSNTNNTLLVKYYFLILIVGISARATFYPVKNDKTK